MKALQSATWFLLVIIQVKDCFSASTKTGVEDRTIPQDASRLLNDGTRSGEVTQCEYEFQEICLTCTISGRCVKSSNGSLYPVPIKSCSPGQICDNHMSSGLCQSKENIGDHECLALSNEPGFKDDFLGNQIFVNSLTQQDGIEATCLSDEQPICVNCTVVGRCSLVNGVFIQVSIFSCSEGYVCDNSLVPGLCQDVDDLSPDIPCLTPSSTVPATEPTTSLGPIGGPTNLPATYCDSVGSFTCFDCNTLGRCEQSGATGITVTPVASCLDSKICDNSVTPGQCQEPSELPGSICLESSPSSYCNASGELVCLDCSNLGVCQNDGEGGFVVGTNAGCLPGLFCDNKFMPGSCQSEEALAGSECLPAETTTSSPTDTTPNPTDATTSVPPGTCVNEGDLVCLDCSTVARCNAAGDPIPSSTCVENLICDNDINPGECIPEAENVESLCVPQLPEFFCNSDTPNVCFDCSSVGRCSDETGSQTVTQISFCLPGSVCDNTFTPGVCQEEALLPATSSCLVTTTVVTPTEPTDASTATDTSTEVTTPTETSVGTSPATAGPTENPGSYCQDGITPCFNCTTIGMCTADSVGGITVIPVATCGTGKVCDNSVSPGLCTDVEELSGSICVAPSPSSFCERIDQLVCFDCQNLGLCQDDGSGGYVVDDNAACFSNRVCDNEVSPGNCMEMSNLPADSLCGTTSFLSQRSAPPYMSNVPEGLCRWDGDQVCYNCTIPGKCRYQAGSGMVVDPVAICAEDLICDNGISRGVCVSSNSHSSSECVSQTKAPIQKLDNEENTLDIFNSCPLCGYMKDPKSTSCRRYLKCSGEISMRSCPEFFCYDETSCSCQSQSLLQNIYAKFFNV